MNNNAIEEREREREREREEREGKKRRGGDATSVGAGQGEQAPERVETAFWELGRVLEVEPLVGTELERRRARRSDTGDVRLTRSGEGGLSRRSAPKPRGDPSEGR
jgi:hypothetical protein